MVQLLRGDFLNRGVGRIGKEATNGPGGLGEESFNIEGFFRGTVCAYRISSSL